MENYTNPFIVGGYVSPEYFCDRKEETEFLIKQVENGRNVVLAASRRIGKSELIHHFFNQPQIRDGYHTFFIDIFATKSLTEFVYLLGKAIFDELKPKKAALAERFFSIISSLRVGFKLDALTGEPTLDIGLGEIQAPQTTLDEIFEYLESADRPCIVAIDEFQQVGQYEEKNVEALLRTKIQRCARTRFIYSGSRRHLMNNMFNLSSRPFYKSAVNMGLEAIPQDVYVDFACRLFIGAGKRVDNALVEQVYERFGGCTWYLQMMMNELFSLTTENGSIGTRMFDTAFDNIIRVQEWSYKDLLARLSPVQKQVLLAVAKDGAADGVTSSEFIRRHALKSASSVQAAMKPLMEYDYITQNDGTYRVSDYFFAEWLRRSC